MCPRSQFSYTGVFHGSARLPFVFLPFPELTAIFQKVLLKVGNSMLRSPLNLQSVERDEGLAPRWRIHTESWVSRVFFPDVSHFPIDRDFSDEQPF